MQHSRRKHLKLLGAALGATVIPARVFADEPTVHEVQMLNKNPDDKSQRMIFLPDLVRAKPGDIVRFISVDKGHNSKSDKDMIPEGAEPWDGKLSKDIEVTLTKEGAYGYYCTPHRTMGMVGLILVGDVSGNYEQAKAVKHRGKSKKVYADIFKRADAMLADEA